MTALAALLVLTASLGTGLALAGESTWLNWVYTGAGDHQYGGPWNLKRVAAQPRKEDFACANAWTGSKVFFSDYYCGIVGEQNQTPEIAPSGSCDPCYADAWNDANSAQDVWSYEKNY